MKRLFAFLGVSLVLVWVSLLFLLLFVSGLHPFTPTTELTPYNSGHVQNNGLFQGWYHMGNCIYIEPDNGCDSGE